MINISDKLKNSVLNISSLNEIGINKGLAKFGDAITNMIFSISKSVVLNNLDARNVNRTILSNALKQADLKLYAKTRSDSHALADTAEAFIGYMYCAENWSIEEMAEILIKELEGFNLNDRNLEISGGIKAFTQLLKKIKEHLELKFN